MSQDKNFADIEAGRIATVISAHARALFDEYITVCTSQLISAYRSGEMNHDFMIGKIAEISATEALASELESRQRRGILASKKEMSNATQQDPS